MSCSHAIRGSKDGVLLDVYVIPGASQAVFPIGYNRWRHRIDMSVDSQAKDNRANRAVLQILGNFFGIPSQDISIVAGLKNREKTILLKNIKRKEVWSKLRESLHGL
jgi:hypothetical protein